MKEEKTGRKGNEGVEERKLGEEEQRASMRR